MKNRKIFYGMVLVLLFASLLTGCGTAKSDSSYEIADYENQSSIREELGVDNSQIEDMDYENMEDEKIISTISITMQTKDFMDTTDKLNSLIEKYKAYVEQSNISYNNYVYSQGLKYSDYNIKIPKENLDLFVNELKQIGNVISENKNITNISKEYRDTESKLRVLEIKEERILFLLEKSEKMEDIIELENQLSNIIYEKERLTGHIMTMDDKIDYSSLIFQLEEVAKLTSSGNIKTSFSDKIRTAFNDSIYFFGNNIESLMISFVYFLPYLLILLVIIYIAYRLIRKRRNRLTKNWDNKDKE